MPIEIQEAVYRSAKRGNDEDQYERADYDGTERGLE